MAHELYVHPHRCEQCGTDRLIPARPQDGIELEKLALKRHDMRYPFKARLTKPRNALVHRLYFSAIAAAARRWPETEEPYPQGSADLLRSWLQIRAGYKEVVIFPVSAYDAVIKLLERTRGEDRYAFVKQTTVDGEPALGVFTSLSIAYDTLSEDEFRPVKESVFSIIEGIFQMDVKTLVEMDEKAEA